MVNKKEPINNSSLFISLIALVIGFIFLVNGSDALFNIIGYLVSGALVLTGLIKILLYSSARKKNNAQPGDFMSALFMIIFGVVIAMFPKFIPITISIVLGILILFNGINRLILGLAVRKMDNQGSNVFVAVSILMIILGIIIITQRFFNLLGAFMIIYAISEIAGYVYYTSQNKDYSEVLNKKVTKEMREKEATDAVIEEEDTNN